MEAQCLTNSSEAFVLFTVTSHQIPAYLIFVSHLITSILDSTSFSHSFHCQAEPMASKGALKEIRRHVWVLNTRKTEDGDKANAAEAFSGLVLGNTELHYRRAIRLAVLAEGGIPVLVILLRDTRNNYYAKMRASEGHCTTWRGTTPRWPRPLLAAAAGGVGGDGKR